MRWVGWLLGAGLMVGSCGYQEGVLQRAEKGYVTFTGNWQDASIVIDDRPPFVLHPPASTQAASQSSANVLYELPPGRHRLTVTREGRVVLDRILILDNHVTTEVRIP